MAKLTTKIILTALFLLAAFLCGDLVQERNYYKQESYRLTAQNDSLRDANTTLTARKKPTVFIQRMKPGKIVD